jgi:chaperonin GroES
VSADALAITYGERQRSLEVMEERTMSVPIQPLGDYVVAQALEAQTKTASGLYLPGNAQEKPKVVKVVATGKEVKSVKVDDQIIYKSFAQTEVKVEGTEYILIKEEDIIATVK